NLCPLIKSTYGYHVQQSNPFLEMSDLIVAETTCDGKKKMYELMSLTRPMYVLELPQKQGDEDGFAQWRRELDKFKKELEDRFQVEITEAKLKAAVNTMNTERRLRRELAEFMKSDQPRLSGRELLDLKSSISGIPCDFKQYENSADFLQNSKPLEDIDSRVRVLMTGVPMAHGAEHVLDLIEDKGGVVVCMESCTGVKPIIEDVDQDAPELMDALAKKYYNLPCSVMMDNSDRLESLRSLIKEYRPQCVIELIWQACLTYDVETTLVKKMVKEELDLPYLRIETDYSPSDQARIAVRVQALFETAREKSLS
ncbi:MAG: 2-hydroxyacyl-CoA dehydratase, partial [Planctomycetes bacterium]|nr:2-hydroxyacyl-CoA dehydratase [Planctomycetota bacterium]